MAKKIDVGELPHCEHNAGLLNSRGSEYNENVLPGYGPRLSVDFSPSAYQDAGHEQTNTCFKYSVTHSIDSHNPYETSLVNTNFYAPLPVDIFGKPTDDLQRTFSLVCGRN